MVYGPQPERLRGLFYLWVYTLVASLPLLGFILLHKSFWFSNNLSGLYFTRGLTRLALLAFLAKGPAYGLHLWLPQTHVEASILGSIFLAGVLLKLSFLGLYRLNQIGLTG